MGKTPKKAAPGGDERNLYNRRPLKATTAASKASETNLHKRQRESESSNRFVKPISPNEPAALSTVSLAGEHLSAPSLPLVRRFVIVPAEVICTRRAALGYRPDRVRFIFRLRYPRIKRAKCHPISLADNRRYFRHVREFKRFGFSVMAF